MTSQYGSLPGQGDMTESQERQVLWDSRMILRKSIVIDSTAVDAGNTPTTTLRAGLLLGKQTADGNHYQWNPVATDGTEVLSAVLEEGLSMLNVYGTAEDKGVVAIASGPLQAAQLLIGGTALQSSDYGNLARAALFRMGCTLDDQSLPLVSAYGPPIREIAKTADYTVVASDNGTKFTTAGASGTVVFTLPAIKPGLAVEFFNVVNQTMSIRSAEGENVIVDGNATADGVDFSTASHKIGGNCRFETNQAGTFWHVRNFSAAAAVMTVADA